MLKIIELKELGFKDLSTDKNGLAYRLRISKHLELCVYLIDCNNLRLQTIGSGFTHNLNVKTKQELKDFIRLFGITK